MRRSAILLAISAFLAPAPSLAQVIVGARLGGAVAIGDVGGLLPMRDWTEGQVPVQLDVLYRVSPRVAVGGYLSWGFGLPGDACDGLDCSATVARLGAQATYAFTGGAFVPWLGANIGYEWNTVEDGSLEGTFTGFELLGLQGGGDYRVNERFGFGPYVTFSIAQYDDVELGGVEGPILDKKMHGWLGLGLRGTFDL